MGRCRIARWGLLFACCLATGCASPSRSGPFAWLQGRSATAPASEKPADKSPWKSDALAKTDAADKPGAVTSATPQAAPNANKVVTHDAATLQLIDWELQDADPAEREELLADFKKVDSETVKLLLKQRRLYRQVGRSQQSSIANAEAISPRNQVPFNNGQYASAEFPGSRTNDLPANGNGGFRNIPGTPLGAAGLTANGGPANTGAYGRFPGNLPVYGSQDGSPRDYGTQKTPADVEMPPIGLGFPNAVHSTPQGVATNASPSQMPVIDPLGASANPAAQAAHLSGPSSGSYSNTSANNSRMTVGAPVNDQGQAAYQGPATYQSPAGYQGAGGYQGNIPPANYGQPLPPAVAGRSPEWQGQMQQLISIAARDAETAHQSLRQALSVSQSDPNLVRQLQRGHLEQQINLRLMYLMTGQHERAVVAIPDIEPADQEFWQQTFWGLANYFDTSAIPNDYDRATQTIAQLRAAVMKLQEKANLEIRNASFCRRISSFGNYETFSVNDFRRRQPVLIYAEVANFRSELTRNSQYRTILRSTIEILDAAGRKVAEPIEFPATEDVCQNHRQDYFHSYEVVVPDNVALGPHVLKLTIQDELSQKVSTYTLRFNVVDTQ